MPRTRPVERTRIRPFWTSETDGFAVLHCVYPVAGSSSTVYCASVPGSPRQTRGSAPLPFQVGLTNFVPEMLSHLRPQIEVVLQAEEVVLDAGLGGAVGELAVLVLAGDRRVRLRPSRRPPR